jgi:hypothetical protein
MALTIATSSFEQMKTDPFQSNIHAFEILADQGLNPIGIQYLKDQVLQLSDGYRAPERKLQDVLAGGAIPVGEQSLVLMHGLGAHSRGAKAGECAESVRALTGAWANSSMQRHLAKAGLHPFYLEVAAPRLFTQIWDSNGRTRAGHSVVALGSPVDYLENGSDDSFVILDPTLGVIEQMNSSSYQQVGFMPVPEVEERPFVLPIAVHDDVRPTSQVANTLSTLILGIDNSAQFAYSLWFKHSKDTADPQIQITNAENALVANFDSGANNILSEPGKESELDQAMSTLSRLATTIEQTPFTIHHGLSSDGDVTIASGKRFKTLETYCYPRQKALAKYIIGLEKAAASIAEKGVRFSLRNHEPGMN